jgi:hypothetical protein
MARSALFQAMSSGGSPDSGINTGNAVCPLGYTPLPWSTPFFGGQVFSDTISEIMPRAHGGTDTCGFARNQTMNNNHADNRQFAASQFNGIFRPRTSPGIPSQIHQHDQPRGHRHGNIRYPTRPGYHMSRKTEAIGWGSRKPDVDAFLARRPRIAEELKRMWVDLSPFLDTTAHDPAAGGN